MTNAWSVQLKNLYVEGFILKPGPADSHFLTTADANKHWSELHASRVLCTVGLEQDFLSETPNSWTGDQQSSFKVKLVYVNDRYLADTEWRSSVCSG